MPAHIGEEVLPTIDELDEMPKKNKEDSLLDAVFEDEEIYRE